MATRRELFILLNLIPEISSAQLRRLLDAFGELERVVRASTKELEGVEGIGRALAQRIATGCRDERRLHEELELAGRHGVCVVTLEDVEYPVALKQIHDPPLALYVRGTLVPSDGVAVAVVGARRASLYGTQCAERLGYDLALRGVTVVSGLARGIDASAHQGALKSGGRTLAVLGNGLSRIYPPEHAELASRIAEQGAVLSEYPMETPPLAHHFPRRNRIISGLTLGVVIVEAAQRSGALITADMALEQGREVFAVPGPITTSTSQGTHALLKQGARMVTGVDDIIEELGLVCSPGSGRERHAASQPAIELPEDEQRILACMTGGSPRYIDTITAESGLASSDVASLLLQLELKRLIQQLPGKQFVRAS